MKKFIYLLGLLISFNAFANPIALIERLQGDIKFNHKPLNTNSVIESDGVIETGEQSFIKIRIDQWGSSLIIGPNSEMKLELSTQTKQPSKALLDKGFVRFRTFNQNQRSSEPLIVTQNASMGVRGTDFLVIATKTLGETEIVVFEGLVDFQNINDQSNRFQLSAGQWGGIGGRFTQNIQPPLTLPKTVLENFSRRLDL